MVDLLVIAEPGDPSSGAFAEAVAAVSDVAVVFTPPEPLTDLSDPVLDLLRHTGAPLEVGVAAGCGRAGWSAQLLALGGRSGALALVDGLPEGFVTPEEAVALRAERMGQLLDGPPEPPRHLSSLEFAKRAAEAIRVPVLVIETPASRTPPEVRDAVVACFSNVRLTEAGSAQEAAGLLAEWAREVRA